MLDISGNRQCNSCCMNMYLGLFQHEKGRGRNMANIIDYLHWRGDLPFSYSPLNEVDSLIFSELVYLNFQGIAEGYRGITLREAAEKYFAEGREKETNTGDLLRENYFILLRKAAESVRFGSVRLSGYVQMLDEEVSMQFAAITFGLEGGMQYVAYRGTDDTLLGWKEDFLMSVQDTVPSQLRAAAYLSEITEIYPKAKLYLGGHSKGGNLAVYSSVHALRQIQQQIIAVFNHDGPGFKESVVDTEAYQNVQNRILTFVPQSSVVGMLLEHEENYIVVHSTQKGRMQHDGFSWEVYGTELVHLQSVTKESKIVDMTIRRVLKEMNDEQKRQFTNALFEVLEANQNRTLTDIRLEGAKAIGPMLYTYDKMDKDTKKALSSILFRLLTESFRSMKEAKAKGELAET